MSDSKEDVPLMDQHAHGEGGKQLQVLGSERPFFEAKKAGETHRGLLHGLGWNFQRDYECFGHFYVVLTLRRIW